VSGSQNRGAVTMPDINVSMVVTRLDMWIANQAMKDHMLLPLLKDARDCITHQQREIDRLDRMLLRNDMYRSEG